MPVSYTHLKDINMEQIDYNDKAVLDSIGTGRTDGIFQLESGGMKSFMKELKPQKMCIRDRPQAA